MGRRCLFCLFASRTLLQLDLNCALASSSVGTRLFVTIRSAEVIDQTQRKAGSVGGLVNRLYGDLPQPCLQTSCWEVQLSGQDGLTAGLEKVGLSTSPGGVWGGGDGAKHAFWQLIAAISQLLEHAVAFGPAINGVGVSGVGVICTCATLTCAAELHSISNIPNCRMRLIGLQPSQSSPAGEAARVASRSIITGRRLPIRRASAITAKPCGLAGAPAIARSP